jgi:hypothetical protein
LCTLSGATFPSKKNSHFCLKSRKQTTGIFLAS